jgi:RNA polymerase sigma-32 factor
MPEPEDKRKVTAEPVYEPEVDIPASDALVPRDALQRYIAEVRHFPPLTADEEHELAVRWQEQGDTEAAYRLITSHLRLVVRMAADFKRSWLNMLDLIQEGNIGLVLAVRKFDPYRGIRLSTYASWWIRAYIIKFLIDNWSMVRVGTTNARRKLLFNLSREKERLEQKGIQPGPKLLAERLDVKEEDVIAVQRTLGQRDASIDVPEHEDTERPLSERIASPDTPADEQVIDQQYRELVSAKLEEFASGLKPREEAVFRERLLAEEPATLQELADRFGLSREGVRQVEKRLMRSLKDFMSEALKNYDGVSFLVGGSQADAPQG